MARIYSACVFLQVSPPLQEFIQVEKWGYTCDKHRDDNSYQNPPLGGPVQIMFRCQFNGLQVEPKFRPNCNRSSTGIAPVTNLPIGSISNSPQPPSFVPGTLFPTGEVHIMDVHSTELQLNKQVHSLDISDKLGKSSKHKPRSQTVASWPKSKGQQLFEYLKWRSEFGIQAACVGMHQRIDPAYSSVLQVPNGEM